MKYRFNATAVVFLFVLVSLGVQAQNTPDLDRFVREMTRVQVENHGRARPYIVTREYRFFQSESAQPDSEVIADVSFVPPGTKDFSIRHAEGSSRGQSVVKRVLEHESEMATDWEQTALTAENYEFSFLGEEIQNGRQCYVLGLEPRRESKELLRGRAWVDAADFRVHRLEGEPTKSPSWWIKKVHVTVNFGNVEGMWLQISAQANAEVRMFGKHSLDSRDLGYRTGEVDARGRQMRPRALESSVGAAILLR